MAHIGALPGAPFYDPRLSMNGPVDAVAADMGLWAPDAAEAVRPAPVFGNTGVAPDSVADILTQVDGCIVGTHFRVDGNT